MNLDFSPEDLAFRDEARAFIAASYPEALRGKQEEGEELDREDYLSWHRVLAAKGWIAPAWSYRSAGMTPPRPISTPCSKARQAASRRSTCRR